MKFSMTGQEKGDLLIQVTAWTGQIVVGKNILCIITVIGIHV